MRTATIITVLATGLFGAWFYSSIQENRMQTARAKALHAEMQSANEAAIENEERARDANMREATREAIREYEDAVEQARQNFRENL